MNRKGLFFAIAGTILLGVIIGVLFPVSLSARQRPTSLSDVVADWGSTSEVLDSDTTPSDVLRMMATSHERWHSLHAVIDIEFDPTKSKVAAEEVWLGASNQARVVITESKSTKPTLVAVSDGEQYTIYDTSDRRYYMADIPPSMWEVGDTSSGEPIELPPGPVTFPHPMTMLLPARSLAYLFPIGFGQSLQKFEDGLTLVGTEQVGNRNTIVLDARLSQDEQLIKRLRFWVDQEYGVIMKAQHFAGDAETWQLQVIVREIDFNLEQPDELFDLELPADATRVSSPVPLMKQETQEEDKK